jgi:hypothetical protein
MEPTEAEKRLAAAAAVTNERTAAKLQENQALDAQSALAEGQNALSSTFPLAENVAVQEDAAGLSGNAIPESDALSRANSVSGLPYGETSATNIESGDNTSSVQLSALFNSVKGSRSSNASSAEVELSLTGEPINKETESLKLTDSLKPSKNTSTAGVSNDTSVTKDLPELLLLKTTQKKEQEERIRAFVEKNPDTVKLVTENTSITRKHSGENAPVATTPRAVSKEITPDEVAAARAKLDETMVAIEGDLKLTLANTDISIVELKTAIKLDKITPDNLDQLPEIIKSGELLKSFGNILRQK